MLIESIGCLFLFSLSAVLASPVGVYMSKVYKNEKSLLDFIQPAERIIFRVCGIDPLKEMGWKQYIVSLLTIHTIWLIWGLMLLLFQGNLFLNPARNPSMGWALALNSAISFL